LCVGCYLGGVECVGGVALEDGGKVGVEEELADVGDGGAEEGSVGEGAVGGEGRKGLAGVSLLDVMVMG
jgi:hypothetical protein